jgi:CheY-like chemotaxis protein
LIVDDEPLVRENIKAYLEDEGMTVMAVASGEEALQRVRQGCDFAVCIMDMRLPGMDGNASIRRLHACCPGMRFIVHTGSASYALPDDMETLGLRERQVYLKPLLDMAPLAAEARRLAQCSGLDAGP